MIEIDYGLLVQSEPPFIGEKDSGLYAELLVTLHDDGLMAQTYIEAPGKGDEIVQLVGERLTALANKSRKKVTHLATPANKGARKLFDRTDGYRRTERHDKHRNPIYEKVFLPQ